MKITQTLIFMGAFMLIACSNRTAFDRFSISPKQKLAENSIQTSKIQNGQNIDGVASVVYLNEVFRYNYKDGEYFYIYFYKKSNKDVSPNFLLNGKKPLEVKELPVNNKFARLVSFKAPWSRYYLVKFSKDSDILKFQLKDGAYSSHLFIFKKDE